MLYFFLKITVIVMERSRIILFDFTVHSTDFWNQENSDCENNSFHLSCCLVLKLNDLQSVNVGLFDQYFRITGEYVLCFKFFLFYILPQIIIFEMEVLFSLLFLKWNYVMLMVLYE